MATKRRCGIGVLLVVHAMRQGMRRMRLKWSARRNGTTLILGTNVALNHPVVVNGKGTVFIGDHAVLGYPLASSDPRPILIQPREREAVIRIGERAVIVNGCEFIARSAISIGEGSLIGARCVIIDSDFHEVRPEARTEAGRSEPVVIGAGCWLGIEVLVLRGVHIGDGSVVGARTTVRGSIPGRVLLVGPPNPAFRLIP